MASWTVEVVAPTLVDALGRPGVDRDRVGVVAARRDHAGADDLVAALSVQLEEILELGVVLLGDLEVAELGAELIVLRLEAGDLGRVIVGRRVKEASDGPGDIPGNPLRRAEDHVARSGRA